MGNSRLGLRLVVIEMQCALCGDGFLSLEGSYDGYGKAVCESCAKSIAEQYNERQSQKRMPRPSDKLQDEGDFPKGEPKRNPDWCLRMEHLQCNLDNSDADPRCTGEAEKYGLEPCPNYLPWRTAKENHSDAVVGGEVSPEAEATAGASGSSGECQ